MKADAAKAWYQLGKRDGEADAKQARLALLHSVAAWLRKQNEDYMVLDLPERLLETFEATTPTSSSSSTPSG